MMRTSPFKIGCAALAASVFLMMGILAGGLVSSTTRPADGAGLQRMIQDLRQAKELVCAGMDRLVIRSRDDSRKEYHLMDRTLWRDADPVISNVESMHFEYRDVYGNLLNRVGSRLSAVHTVSCVIRWVHGRENRHVNTRILINDPLVEASEIAWAYSRDP